MDLDIIRRCYHGKMEISSAVLALAQASNARQNELVNAAKDRTNAQSLVQRSNTPYTVAWDRNSTEAVIDGVSFPLDKDFWRKNSWYKAEHVSNNFMLSGKRNHKQGLAFNRAMEPILNQIKTAVKDHPDVIHYLLDTVEVQHGFKTLRVLNMRGYGVQTSAFLDDNTLYVRIPMHDWDTDEERTFVPPKGFTEITAGQHLDSLLEHTKQSEKEEANEAG